MAESRKNKTKKKGSLARAEPVRAALHLSPRRGIELDASQVLRPAGRRACVLVAAVTNFPRRSDLDGFVSLAHVPGFEFRVDEVTRRMQHAIDALKGGGGDPKTCTRLRDALFWGVSTPLAARTHFRVFSREDGMLVAS